jgi:hypothetical protein
MKAFKKKKAGSNLTRKQALGSTPVKNMNVTEIQLDSGEVILTYPLEVRPWLAGLGRRLGITPNTTQTKKIQLDALGTSVWEQMDGKRSVREIIQEFVKKHQLHPKEAEVAVTQFLRNLGKRGLIGLK